MVFPGGAKLGKEGLTTRFAARSRSSAVSSTSVRHRILNSVEPKAVTVPDVHSLPRTSFRVNMKRDCSGEGLGDKMFATDSSTRRTPQQGKRRQNQFKGPSSFEGFADRVS